MGLAGLAGDDDAADSGLPRSVVAYPVRVVGDVLLPREQRESERVAEVDEVLAAARRFGCWRLETRG